jgi:hypothetical protein
MNLVVFLPFLIFGTVSGAFGINLI